MTIPLQTAKPRRGIVVAAVLFVLLVIATGTANLLSQFVQGTFHQTDTLVPRGDRFTVQGAAGNVTLNPSPDGNVHVRTTVHYGISKPEFVQRSTPTGVLLHTRCDGLLATRCDVDYLIEVPPSFAVDVELEAGEVSVNGLAGPVTVDVSAGDVTLLDVSGALDVSSSSGEIRGLGLRSAVVRADTSSGDVRMELIDPPQSVRVDVGSGEVDLAVPVDVDYRVDADTASGEERIAVPVRTGSDRTITVDGGSGDVRIRPVR
ncbi:DUF4097 family beta strand repeat-containing protein [Pseudonocardia nigra]|uniref:DUF4097 family beta strand repeat-containing protein n=1 Tax=Pseudonocardia nigra TaxID=1921578 RepID=UPI001C5E2EA9|nr:DUF4097 family beta strand repeat-containing protein [Pseudonocardia nigra]